MRRYFLPFLLLIVLAAGLLWIPDATWAQTGAAPQPDPASYELFPNESSALGDYRQYIRAFYKFSIAAGILIATVLIMIGGMIWVTSAGNPGRIDKAKSYIIDSIIGVILLISAYTILQVLNPNLVALPDIKSRLIIGNVGACVYQLGSKSYCRVATADDCTKPNSSQTAAGITAGSFKKDTSCAAACPQNQDGSCTEAGSEEAVNQAREDAIARARYCSQFSTTGEAVNERVADSGRFDTWQNCQTYCYERSNVSSIPYRCSGAYDQQINRCNCS